MEKMNLKNKTELEIMNGASLNAITAVADGWTALGEIAEALKESGNLDEVQFKTDETVTGEYRNMKLESPLFSAVDIAEDGKIHATLASGKRQKWSWQSSSFSGSRRRRTQVKRFRTARSWNWLE